VTPLAVTMGEPAGIGGEILLKAWTTARDRLPPFLAIDDPGRLARLARRLGLEAAIDVVADPEAVAGLFSRAIPVLPLGMEIDAEPGRPDPRFAPAVLAAIDRGVDLARAGRVAALVTNPIAKSVLAAGGFRHPGHTEYLADRLGVGAAGVAMMLVAPELRVVPVTIHMSLAEAIRRLDADLIVAQARITASGLRRDFGLASPRLALAGLNPHAGEDGKMGDEDARIVAPAIARLRAEGIDAKGPFPADTLFHPAARKRYDVALGMYHDQALIPLKTLDFAGGVNVTLGLPIVRTSPDHGTAFDIAGQGVADPASLIAALRLAGEMAARRGQGAR